MEHTASLPPDIVIQLVNFLCRPYDREMVQLSAFHILKYNFQFAHRPGYGKWPLGAGSQNTEYFPQNVTWQYTMMVRSTTVEELSVC